MVGTSDTSQGIFDIRLRRRSSDTGRLLKGRFWEHTPLHTPSSAPPEILCR